MTIAAPSDGERKTISRSRTMVGRPRPFSLFFSLSLSFSPTPSDDRVATEYGWAPLGAFVITWTGYRWSSSMGSGRELVRYGAMQHRLVTEKLSDRSFYITDEHSSVCVCVHARASTNIINVMGSIALHQTRTYRNWSPIKINVRLLFNGVSARFKPLVPRTVENKWMCKP